MTGMRPMLASPLDWNRMLYPVYVSPKLDGIRCIVWEGEPHSRTWKVLRNRHLQDLVATSADVLDGLDGELVVGDPAAPNVYNRTTSGVMSEFGAPKITYLVFDYVSIPDQPYLNRLGYLKGQAKMHMLPAWVKVLPQILCNSKEDVERIEVRCLELGYEGVIVRRPRAPYKYGRSTAAQGYLLKLKRFVDAEAVVVGYEELMHNENEATTSIQGYTQRTSHQAGQRPGGMLGALVVQSLTTPPARFSIGSGFDHATRTALWNERRSLRGRVVTYKSQPHGALNAPRFPIFKGFRHEDDLDTHGLVGTEDVSVSGTGIKVSPIDSLVQEYEQ
jgi:DNA ligase-1